MQRLRAKGTAEEPDETNSMSIHHLIIIFLGIYFLCLLDFFGNFYLTHTHTSKGFYCYMECRRKISAELFKSRWLASHFSSFRHLRSWVLTHTFSFFLWFDSQSRQKASHGLDFHSFQEIVPLNAGNVLGTEDNGPARKWVSLIRRTLNSLPGGSCRTPSPVPHPVAELDSDFEGDSAAGPNSFFYHRSRSMRMDLSASSLPPQFDRRFSVCDRFMLGDRPDDFYDQSFRYCSSEDEPDSPSHDHYSPVSRTGSFVADDRDKSKYCLVASKQMVGIFLTVWVKSDLRDSVKNLKVSCVGRGLMGYLGNKVNSTFPNPVFICFLYLSACQILDLFFLSAGLHFDQHVRSPDKLLLCLQPLDVWSERRRRAKKKLWCFGDSKENQIS